MGAILRNETASTRNVTVTVVICTRDRAPELAVCLAALRETAPRAFDALVVDSASVTRAAEDVARRFGARYLRLGTPGLSKARNAGVRASSSDIVAFLDDDAIPEPGWLEALVCEFSDPNVMAVTGCVHPTSVETEAETQASCLYDGGLGRPRHLRIDRSCDDWFAMSNFGGMGIGCNMAFRRTAFTVWPGFDERLGRGAPLGGGEENFAFFNLVRLGYAVVYTPEAIVRHPYPDSMESLRAEYVEDWTRAAAYMSMLMAEQPGHRLALVRYVLAWIRKSPRSWCERVSSKPALVPKWKTIIAVFRGPFRYLRACIRYRWRAGRASNEAEELCSDVYEAGVR